MFIGRRLELERLSRLKTKSTASLVVVRGRRRIGKSTLIEHFGASFEHFYEFQGLAPRPGLDDAAQLQNFSEQLSRQFDLPTLSLEHWHQAFSLLASQTRTGPVLILLDEVSWMASHAIDFPGKLKIAWDTQFKKNPDLILALCGSVSSWIDRNLLKDADFVGRVSLDLVVNELPLVHCNAFWDQQQRADRISSMEKLKILAVTGGVPKYLEEVQLQRSAEDNINALCFQSGGFLVNEFERIFNSIFDKRAPLYRELVESLVDGRRTTKEIVSQVKRKQNGDISHYLNDLMLSGFITRDYAWNLEGKKSRISYYRIKDNFLRFYLKYIAPNKEKIDQGLYEYTDFTQLGNWPIVLGLQFENLVLNNTIPLLGRLGIEKNNVISASPHFQRKTQKNKGACQIDLLIHTRFDNLYLCEIKCRQHIDNSVIDEVQRKIDILSRPKRVSIRTVLIYEGELAPSVEKSGFFDFIVRFQDMLEGHF